MASCGDPCEGIDWDPQTLAQSIAVTLYVDIAVYEDGIEVKKTVGEAEMSAMGLDGIGFKVYDRNKESTAPSGSPIREVFPLLQMSPAYLTGEISHVNVAYDAPIDFLFDDVIYLNTNMRVAGYIGYPSTIITRCDPVIPWEGYDIDVTFEFVREVAGAAPVAVKCVLSRRQW